MQLRKSIELLMQHQNLDPDLCEASFTELLSDEVNPLHASSFLLLMRSKPETVNEFVTMLTFLKKNMIKVPTTHRTLDIVGTGGDGKNTVNISTGAAILAASCGIKVAKHGNRAVSSRAGSADVLEALGVNIMTTPEHIAESIDEIGIGFCFAPAFHPLLAHMSALRKKLGLMTTFNLLGPLLNPAGASHYLLGVADPALQQLFATVLQKIHAGHSLIVHGEGLDEISTIGKASVTELIAQEIKTDTLDPLQFQLPRADLSALQGGDAATNAKLLRETLQGKRGALADTLILNAAIALYLYGNITRIIDAIEEAKENLYNGAAFHLLTHWIEHSHE